MTVKIRNIIPLLIVLFFMMPPSISAFIPESTRLIYYYLVIALYWAIFMLFLRPIFFTVDKSWATPFTILLCSMAVVSFLVKGEISLFNLIFPISSLGIYKICISSKANFQHIFPMYFLFLYFIFYIYYYSIIPDFFYRPDFNESMLYGASSNAIPFALNNSLIACMILNFLYNGKSHKTLLIISVINLLLNVIQQGRSGILVAGILVLVAIYEFSPKIISRYKYFFISLSVVFISLLTISIINLVDNISFSDYSFLQEKRVLAQIVFFEQLSSSNFIFGANENTWFADEQYTFNMFLDFWNKYNFFTLCILLGFLIYRVVKKKLFFFPVYYLIPLSVYIMFESIFLPSFWDFFLYLFLFLPKDHQF